MSDETLYSIHVHPGSLSEECVVQTVTATKRTTALEVIDKVVSRLGLNDGLSYVLIELHNVKGEEMVLAHTDHPVRRMLLWPIQYQHTYKFLLRQTDKDGTVLYHGANSWQAKADMDSTQHHMEQKGFLPPTEPSEEDCPDLCALSNLTQDKILEVLKMRFLKDKIYTYTANMLISVNPYKFLPIYNPKFMTIYQNRKREELAPHIYAVADTAFTKLVESKQNQCIVITGKSGSGKTQATHFLVHHTLALCQKSYMTGVEHMLIGSGPVLEAFGNAETDHNNNSSRFGKFLRIYFYESGLLSGADIQTYLLEKSRLVHQEASERNFHIFYYLLCGASDEELQELHLDRDMTYEYVSKDSMISRHEATSELDRLRQAMEVIGFFKGAQKNILKLISAILLLGNITFRVKKGRDEALEIEDDSYLESVSSLLSLDTNRVRKCLLTRKAKAGAGERFVLDLKLNEAKATRDAMAKALYQNLFEWTVNSVNMALAQRTRDSKLRSQSRWIGFLDIFGFEDFVKNSFEQFCINYASEHLQHYCIKHTFQIEQAAYKEEGLTWKEVDYADNSGCLELYEKKPMGLFYLIDENYPGANNQTLLSQFNRIHSSNHYFESPVVKEDAFIIKHYAGKVKYKIKDFREKNHDQVREDIITLLRTTKSSFIQEVISKSPAALFRWSVLRAVVRATFAFKNASNHTPNEQTRLLHNTWRYEDIDGKHVQATYVHKKMMARLSHSRHREPSLERISRFEGSSGSFHGRKKPTTMRSKKKFNSISQQYQASLSALLSALEKAAPYFVRCIQPNNKKVPLKLDEKLVLHQLRCSGTLQTIQLEQSRYPERLSTDQFLEQYKLLFPKTQRLLSLEDIKKYFTSLNLNVPKHFQIGHSQVFLRNSAFHVLRDEVHKAVLKRVVFLQSRVRGYIARKCNLQQRAAAIKIQSFWRMIESQREIEEWHLAASIIQEAWHRYKNRKLKAFVVNLQAVCRRYLARKNAERKRALLRAEKEQRSAALIQKTWHKYEGRKQAAALTIQKSFRGYAARTSFKKLLKERREEIRLQKLSERTEKTESLPFIDSPVDDPRFSFTPKNETKTFEDLIASKDPSPAAENDIGNGLLNGDNNENTSIWEKDEFSPEPLDNRYQRHSLSSLTSPESTPGFSIGSPTTPDEPSFRQVASIERSADDILPRKRISVQETLACSDELKQAKSSDSALHSSLNSSVPNLTALTIDHDPFVRASSVRRPDRLNFDRSKLLRQNGASHKAKESSKVADIFLKAAFPKRHEKKADLPSPYTQEPNILDFSIVSEPEHLPSTSYSSPHKSWRDNVANYTNAHTKTNEVHSRKEDANVKKFQSTIRRSFSENGKISPTTPPSSPPANLSSGQRKGKSSLPTFGVFQPSKNYTETTFHADNMNVTAEKLSRESYIARLQKEWLAFQRVEHERQLRELDKRVQEGNKRENQQERRIREEITSLRLEQMSLLKEKMEACGLSIDSMPNIRSISRRASEKTDPGIPSPPITPTSPKAFMRSVHQNSEVSPEPVKSRSFPRSSSMESLGRYKSDVRPRRQRSNSAFEMHVDMRAPSSDPITRKASSLNAVNAAAFAKKCAERQKLAALKDESSSSEKLETSSPQTPSKRSSAIIETVRKKFWGSSNKSNKEQTKQHPSLVSKKSSDGQLSNSASSSGHTKASSEDLSSAEVKFRSTEAEEYSQKLFLSKAEELLALEDFVKKKMKSFDGSNLVDQVFKSALNEFCGNLTAMYSLLLNSGSTNGLRYKDIVSNFRLVLEKNAKNFSLDQYAAMMAVNGFRGYMNEFMNDVLPKHVVKEGRTKKKKRKEDALEKLGHHFTPVQWGINQVCEFCGGTMWLMESGLVCKVCKFACHKKCSSKLTNKCSGASSSGKAKSKPKKLFGESLINLSANESCVPVFVDKCISYMEANGLYQEGIYRRSAAATQIKQLTEVLNKDPECQKVNFDDYNIHSVAACFKKFLRSLPEPLVPQDKYFEFLQASKLNNDREKITSLFNVLEGMPDHNHSTLERIIFHLARVAQQEPTNLMTPNNLAIVFTPCFFTPPAHVSAVDAAEHVGKMTRGVEMIIIEQAKKIRSTLESLSELQHAETSTNERLKQIRQSLGKGKKKRIRPSFREGPRSPTHRRQTSDRRSSLDAVEEDSDLVREEQKYEKQMESLKSRKDTLTTRLTALSPQLSSDECEHVRNQNFENPYCVTNEHLRHLNKNRVSGLPSRRRPTKFSAPLYAPHAPTAPKEESKPLRRVTPSKGKIKRLPTLSPVEVDSFERTSHLRHPIHRPHRKKSSSLISPSLFGKELKLGKSKATQV